MTMTGALVNALFVIVKTLPYALLTKAPKAISAIPII